MSNYKFKKGDRVRNLEPNYENVNVDRYKFGEKGTVDENHSTCPWVLWDNGNRSCQNQEWLELLTDEKPANHSGDVNEMMLGGAPQPNTLEWWRWHYAGLAMQGVMANEHMEKYTYKAVSEWSVEQANDLIAKLQKKGGEQ